MVSGNIADEETGLFSRCAETSLMSHTVKAFQLTFIISLICFLATDLTRIYDNDTLGLTLIEMQYKHK